ncbi:restriction endonuclease [Sessilibacter corallicola]|uniref:restriction endonuclease n=1 Tax=Sessilibacter corallicola TaxID=2904075 RepID=UPI001E2D527D|nr:restriction endonuclease [Sessilibacter corallicola]MCE2029932.1 restriction endonuclease [Sessilibacter corallicola]
MAKDDENEEEIKKVIDSFQQPFDKLSAHSNVLDSVRNFDINYRLPFEYERLQNLLETIELYDPLLKYPSLSNLINSTSAWDQAIQLQDSSRFPSYIENILSGFQIPTTILNGIADVETNFDRIARINEQLGGRHLFLFELSLDQYEQELEEESENSSLIADLNGQLKRVNFIPMRVFERICRDPNLMHGLNGRDFEYVVAEILHELGFLNVNVTPQSGDGGRDITATIIENGFPVYVAVECKRRNEKIGPSHLRSLLGTISLEDTRADRGILVTNSSFTPGSQKIILSSAPIYGRDFNDLVRDLRTIANKRGLV